MRLFIYLGLSALSCLASAQSTQAGLKTRVVNQTLYLRDRSGSDSLKFNSDGILVSPVKPTSFTLSGVLVRSIELGRDSLTLKGQRMGLEFVQDRPVSVMLRIPNGAVAQEESIRIEIKKPASGDYTDALDRGFARNVADLVPSLSPYWQPFARAHLLPLPEPNPDTSSEMPPLATAAFASGIPREPRLVKEGDHTPGDIVFRVGGGVTPPRLLAQVAPEFSPQARANRYSANVS